MKLIYEEGPFTVQQEYEITGEMIHLLENTHWGTGKTVYQHFNSEEHLRLIPKPHIFTVREQGVLRAFVVFCERYFPGLPNAGKAYYARFFAAAPEVKGMGVVRNLAPIVVNWLRENEGQTLFYAFIEARNPAVNKVVINLGFHLITTVKTLGFSRFFPRKKLPVEQLAPQEWAFFLPQLEAAHADKSLWMRDNLYVHQQYFVFREGGEVQAGVQVHKAHWALLSMPGWVGKALKVVPYIPLLRNIVNPEAFHFLTFEAFYCLPGKEHLIPDLIESLLAHFGYHSALFWLDARDPLNNYFQEAQLGILHAFVKKSNVSLIGSFNHYPPELERSIEEKVFYLSSLDSI